MRLSLTDVPRLSRLPRLAARPRGSWLPATSRLPGAARSADRPRPAVATLEQRNRRAEGPQDRALYTCSCGAIFSADVSATVSCPRCGLPQAW